METGQIIITTILFLVSSISFFGVNFAKKKTNVMLFSILWAVVTAMLFSCLIISLELKK